LSTQLHTFALGVLLFAALPGVAHASTRYVGETGVDGPTCGVDALTPCRSITQAIGLAAPGDTILVAPGRYGDLNRSGTLGDSAGEETGSPGCSCVLSLNKNVILLSSGGAAVTEIDATTVNVNTTVLVITNGGELGRPGKGFTITETGRRADEDFRVSYQGSGVVIDAANVLIRGNQVVFTRAAQAQNPSGTANPARSDAFGIASVSNASTTIRIEGNQVTGWLIGIYSDGPVVSKNQVAGNYIGIHALGSTVKVTGNVATANRFGFQIVGCSAPCSTSATISGNAAYNNRDFGFYVSVRSGAVLFSKNNMFSNGPGDGSNCGLGNGWNNSNLRATNNYWGSPSGPGGAPADKVCDVPTPTSPFASAPFAVKVLKP
jgi:hypothetical protein